MSHTPSLRWLSLLAALLMAAVLAGPAAWAAPPVAPREAASLALAAPLMVDGDLSDWPAGNALTVDWAASDMRPATPLAASDLSAEVRSAWDARYLYFAIRVWDDAVHPADGPNDWDDDRVEIGLDGARDRDPWGADDHEYIVGADGRVFDKGIVIQRALAARRLATDGYTIELAVPLSDLTAGAVAAGTRMGLTVGLVDDDDGGAYDARLVWEGPSALDGAADFGDLVFSGTAPRLLVLQDGLEGYAGAADAFLDAWAANTAHGAEGRLELHKSGVKRPLLAFDLSALPPNWQGYHATLSLYVEFSDGGATAARAYEVRRPWREREATWNLALAGEPWAHPGANGLGADPDRAAEPAYTATLRIATGWARFDVTDMLAGWAADPAANPGLLLVGAGPASYRFYSSDAAETDLRPVLEISYALPATPTSSPTPTSSASPTWTPSATWTATATGTATPSATGTATATPSATPTWTATATGTATPSPTWTATDTHTATATTTPTATPTATPVWFRQYLPWLGR